MAESQDYRSDARHRRTPVASHDDRRYRHRCRGPLLARALLLAVALVAVSGLPLDARASGYAPVLAYNGEAPAADNHFTFQAGYRTVAQLFTTGPNPAGYSVDAVAVHTGQSRDKSAFRLEGYIAELERYRLGDWSVRLPGTPASMPFFRPEDVRDFRWSWWRAMAPAHLQPNTTYAFVLQCKEGCADDKFVEIGCTDSDAEEGSTLEGWSIGDGLLYTASGSNGIAGSGWSGDMLLAADGTFGLNPAGPAILIRIEGRPESVRPQHLADPPVPPVTVSDAMANEAPGAALAFDVTLDAPRTEALTLRYATHDGTARAGADYERATGTLTFAPGETTQAIEMAVLDDARDEGTETLTLRLSDAAGTPLAAAEGTGTIVNGDPVPRVWLAHVGKTVGAQIADTVGGRGLRPRVGL